MSVLVRGGFAAWQLEGDFETLLYMSDLFQAPAKVY